MGFFYPEKREESTMKRERKGGGDVVLTLGGEKEGNGMTPIL